MTVNFVTRVPKRLVRAYQRYSKDVLVSLRIKAPIAVLSELADTAATTSCTACAKRASSIADLSLMGSLRGK